MPSPRSLTTLSKSLRRALTLPHPKPQLGTCAYATSSHIRTHVETSTVCFTPPQVYSVVRAVDEYHHFVPWCTHSEITHTLSPTTLIADLSVGFRLLSETYTSVITLNPNRSVTADVPHSALFKYLLTDWRFEPSPIGTQLTFRVEFAFNNHVYRRVTDMFFDQVAKQMVSAFEKRCAFKFQPASPNAPTLF